MNYAFIKGNKREREREMLSAYFTPSNAYANDAKRN